MDRSHDTCMDKASQLEEFFYVIVLALVSCAYAYHFNKTNVVDFHLKKKEKPDTLSMTYRIVSFNGVITLLSQKTDLV